MGIIKILDKNVIDQIAAGEVIERPVSIVKELIENSIDAGADSIEVEIKKGGKSYIGIRDNGKGILQDDIDVIFERHATSKISCLEDLYESCSLGFRGEALSSIAAVSKVTLTTRHKYEDLGSKVIVQGGEELARESIAVSKGTSILVEDLFFNTPVRHKFLKSDTSEAVVVSDMIERLALCRADIAFHYSNNGKELLNTTGSGDLSEVIYRLYGKEVYDNLLEIDAELSVGRLFGYIGKPVISRGNRNRQSLFINNRYVKSFLLMKAIQEGYSSFLMQHRFPVFVLKLSIDPASMDVNVHPSKMEVNFESPSLLYKEIYHAVRNRLIELDRTDVTQLRYENETEVTEITEVTDATDNRSEAVQPQNRSEFADSPFSAMDLDFTKQLMKSGVADFSYQKRSEVYREREEESRYYEAKEDKEKAAEDFRKEYGEAVENIRIIGQAFKTYILAEIGDTLYIVDQHAAHEKINFERLMKGLNEERYSQQLLKPAVLQLTAKEELTVQRYMEVFEQFGFEIEHFGGQAYTVRAVPMSFYNMDINRLFVELLDHLGEMSEVGNIERIKDRIAGVACKASIKGGQNISDLEAEHLIRELLKLEAPFQCPHGRPTMIAMSRYELEKKFKRIV